LRGANVDSLAGAVGFFPTDDQSQAARTDANAATSARVSSGLMPVRTGIRPDQHERDIAAFVRKARH